jgi:hypothetical protein
MLIWFNSPSIQKILDSTPAHTLEIGCNHLYRLRRLSHCVAYDPRTRDQIIQDLQEHQNGHLPQFFCRNGSGKDFFKDVITPNRLAPEDSGTLAIALAIFYLKQKDIGIVGCDWHTDETRSLFDARYTHKKIYPKVTNSKLQLLRTYQRELGVRFCFYGERPISKEFAHAKVEDLSYSSS